MGYMLLWKLPILIYNFHHLFRPVHNKNKNAGEQWQGERYEEKAKAMVAGLTAHKKA